MTNTAATTTPMCWSTETRTGDHCVKATGHDGKHSRTFPKRVREVEVRGPQLFSSVRGTAECAACGHHEAQHVNGFCAR
jgi:hypothetical protein